MKRTLYLGFTMLVLVLVFGVAANPALAGDREYYRHHSPSIMPFLPPPPPIMPMPFGVSFGNRNFAVSARVEPYGYGGHRSYGYYPRHAYGYGGYDYISPCGWNREHYSIGNWSHHRAPRYGAGGDGPPCAAWVRWQVTGRR